MAEIARAGLGVAGGLIGGWQGYLVGTLIGGLLFPPASKEKPENLAGMRLAGPTPGTPLPITMGRVLVRGHVIWQGPLIEQQGKKGGGQGKKGGGETSFRRSFMHALCEGHPDIGLLRIYNGDDLLWDANDPAPGQESGIDFTFYPGTATETPDPRMAAYQSGGAGLTTTIRTETATLNGAAPTHTVRDVPVVSGSDSIWAATGGVITPFTRVAGTPGQNEYTINYTTGLITFGGTYSNIAVTIRYRVSTQTSAQEPLAYRHVCKVYVHEFPLVGQSLPQLTYEIAAPVVAADTYGAVGWTQATEQDPGLDPPPYFRNRFFRVRSDGVYEQLGLWGDLLTANEGGTPGKWRVDGLVYHPTDQHWYVTAVKFKGGLVHGLESAVFRTPTLPPPGTFDSPGAGVTRMAWTDFGPGEWSIEEDVWDPVVGPDDRVYFLRDVPANVGIGTGLISVDATGDTQGHGSFGTGLCSLAVHDGRIYAAGGIEFLPKHRLGYFDPDTGLWTELTITFDSPPGSGPAGHEDLRLESFGANRLYYSALPGNKTYRLRESDNVMVLQTGLPGAITDWFADAQNNRLIGVGNGFIASTPLNVLTDAWTVLVSGTGEAHVGIGSPKDKLAYFIARQASATRIRRLNADNTVTTLATVPDGIGRRSRMMANGTLPGAVVLGGDDVNAADVVRALMTHTRWGGGLPQSLINSLYFAAAWDHVQEQDLLVAVVIESPTTLLQAIEEVLAHYFGWLAFRQGQFVFGAQREETALREIVLDDAVEGGELTFSLPGERDTKNRIRVDYTDRGRRYNTMQTHVSDDPDRAARGERAENLRLPWFTTAERARRVAAKMLALKAVPRAGYEMTLGPKEIALAPGDVVALTAAKLGLSLEPVRIVAIGESEDRAEYRITFASEPSAALAVRTYPIQPLNPGDQPGPAFADPGPTLLTVWEVPPELAGEDVLMTAFIVAGTGNPEWRGASIYMSLDGTDYSRVATVLGANGEIGRVILGRDAGSAYEDMGALDVDLGVSLGTLLSYTRNQALAGVSMSLAGQQHLSYRQADLQAANAYRLRGLMRGWFEQSQVNVAPGDGFTFIGDFLGLPAVTHPHGRIGSTVYFKALSINRFGVEQSLADAQAVAVTLQGLARRPSPVYGLQVDLGGVAQGSRAVIGTGQIDVSCRWRYARRDNPEDADLVDGAEVTAKHPEFLDYRVQVYTRASGGDAWGLRRTVFQTGETFTYTAAQNIADNGAYHPFIRFDVAVRRANGVVSITRTLAVEVVQ